MIRLSLLPLPFLALGACAGATPPPAIALDAARFQPATREAELPRPVEIVTVPQPLPLPPRHSTSPDHTRHVTRHTSPHRQTTPCHVMLCHATPPLATPRHAVPRHQ